MEALLDNQKLFLFVMLVFPGLVSMVVYRLVLPAAPIEWKHGIIQGLFYSVVNYALCSWLLVLIDFWRHSRPLIAAFLFTVVVLVAPIVWPLVARKLLRSQWIAARLQLPFPTGWDFFFDRRIPCFVLITLKNGGMIGGFFGPGSYAGSFPNHGDIYVRHVYKINENGGFLDPVEDSLGLWVQKDEYSLIEFFAVPV